MKNIKWVDGYPYISGQPASEQQFQEILAKGIRPEEKKKPKVQKSEAEISRQYAKIIMDKQRTRGMMSQQFQDLKKKTTINKDLWQDSDFFFSVVFQSAQQKYEFLTLFFEKFGIEPEDSGRGTIQIINGLKFADQLKFPLKKEVAADYPCGNIDLKQFILDEERK